MPLSRRALSLRPIHSEKRENTWSFLVQNASSTQVVTLLDTVNDPSVGNEASIGSHVKWIYVEFNLNGVDNSGTAQVFHWSIYKDKNNTVGTLDPATYDLIEKSNIIKRGMEMLPAIPLGSGGTVQTKRIFTVRIPKGMQRMGERDKIKLTYKSTSASSINFCGISIFKYLQ